MEIRDRIKELRRVKASELRANPKNWRKHPAAQRRGLEAVLREVGFADALLAREVDGTGQLELIDGHLRQDVMGEAEVPVLVLDVTEEEARKLLVSLDPLAAMAEADGKALESLLKEFQTEDDAVKKFLEDVAKDNKVDFGRKVVEDEAPPVLPKAVSRMGELWVMGDHRLLCGDSTKKEDVKRVMGGERATLVVTSPPYNQGLERFIPSGMHTETKWVENVQSGSYFDSFPEDKYQKQQTEMLRSWASVMTATGSVFYNHKNRYRDKEVVSPWAWISASGAKVRQEIIWKREGSVTQNARMFLPCDERIFWLYFGDGFYFDDSTEIKTWSSVWTINSHKDRDGSNHGCAFPVEIPARCIQACSRVDEIVVEPYCGSGTTLIAAEQLSRRCFAIEIEPRYVDVAVRRWQNATHLDATLSGTGETFNALAKSRVPSNADADTATAAATATHPA